MAAESILRSWFHLGRLKQSISGTFKGVRAFPAEGQQRRVAYKKHYLRHMQMMPDALK